MAHHSEEEAACDDGPGRRCRVERGAVEVAFIREGDRWRHVVAVAGVVVARSVEGPWPPDGDDHWPASPVITEILEVAVAGGSALAGVGRAGRSHFSMSVAAASGQPETLLVEIACRIHDGPGWLGSTYRLTTAAADPDRDAAGGGADPLLRISAAEERAGGLPRTVRWSYAIGPAGIVPAPPAPSGGADLAITGPIDHILRERPPAEDRTR